MTCLVVDIGNTSTSIAVMRGRRVLSFAHFPTRSAVTSAGVRARLQRLPARSVRSVEGAVVASVVPAVNAGWRAGLTAALGRAPLFVTNRARLGVKVSYPRPRMIGADRLANASAALELFGAPAMVADFGTALTFDILREGGVYVGGVIAPGLPLMVDYLAERTALLPRISLRGRVGRVGRSTAGAMRIGARVGYRGMVREVVKHVCSGPGMQRAKLCATGGYARWALSGLDLPFVIDPYLTLRGLARIFELNQDAGRQVSGVRRRR